jgi:hypothetical protein
MVYTVLALTVTRMAAAFFLGYAGVSMLFKQGIGGGKRVLLAICFIAAVLMLIR